MYRFLYKPKWIVSHVLILGLIVSMILLMFWQLRQRGDALRWHAIVWMPLVLLGWALGSMAWSHTYLAGVEAVRWFVFALLLWVGMNTLSVGLAHRVIAGIHWGSVVATESEYP